MSDAYETLLPKFEELCSKLESVSENLLPPKNLSKSRNSISNEIEQKMRDEAKAIKTLRAEHAKLEKELKVKQDSVTQYMKSYEQLENRITRTREKYEEKVKQENQRKALLSSVFNFLEIVGFDFEVINLENDSSDSLIGTYKVSFSKLNSVDPEKVYSITFKTSSDGIQISETNMKELESDFKKVEEYVNKNLKPGQINFIPFLVRARKLIINRLQSS